MTRYPLLTASCLLLLSLSYCGTARRGTPLYAPLTVENAAVANGETVYMTSCQKCHPGGAAGLGPAINDKPLPGFLLRFQVRNGLGVMPAFKEDVISDEQLDDLVAYLKALRKAKEEPAQAAR